MTVHVIAKDKADNGRAYHVEECQTYDAAKAVKEYVQQRVDGERWAIDTSYTRMGMDDWDKRVMQEAANAPKEDA